MATRAERDYHAADDPKCPGSVVVLPRRIAHADQGHVEARGCERIENDVDRGRQSGDPEILGREQPDQETVLISPMPRMQS